MQPFYVSGPIPHVRVYDGSKRPDGADNYSVGCCEGCYAIGDIPSVYGHDCIHPGDYLVTSHPGTDVECTEHYKPDEFAKDFILVTEVK